MSANVAITGESSVEGHWLALIWSQRADVTARLETDLRNLKWRLLAAHSAERAADLATRERPELIVASFVGQPAAYAGRVSQRLRSACPRRDLTVLGLLEPRQIAEIDPAWGLDTFLVYPYSCDEFKARIALARWRSSDASDGLIKAGPLVIDPLHYSVSVSGRVVGLTTKEYDLLRLLVAARGRVFTRQQALAAVWGDDYYGGERTVDVHIRRLRAKLPEIDERIETVHGVGYKFA